MPEDTMSAAAATDTLTVSSEFDIFAYKPIQTSVLETIESLQTYRPRRTKLFGISDTC